MSLKDSIRESLNINLKFLSKEGKAVRAAAHPSNSTRTSAKDALESCVCSGWMVKEGGNVKSWKHRFVVFDGTTLFYFKSETAAEQAGEVAISALTSITTTELPKKPNLVKMESPHRTFLFQAKNEDDMMNWHTVLTAAKQQQDEMNSSGGNTSPTGIPIHYGTLGRSRGSPMGTPPQIYGSLRGNPFASTQSTPTMVGTPPATREHGGEESPYGTPPVFGTPPSTPRGGLGDRSGSIVGTPPTKGGSPLYFSAPLVRERGSSSGGGSFSGQMSPNSPIIVKEWVKDYAEGTIEGPTGSWKWKGDKGDLLCTEGRFIGASCYFTGDRFYHTFNFGGNVDWDTKKLRWSTTYYGVLYEAVYDGKSTFTVPKWDPVVVSSSSVTYNKQKHTIVGSVPAVVLAVIALLIRAEDEFKQREEWSKKFKAKGSAEHAQRLQLLKQEITPQRTIKHKPRTPTRPKIPGYRCGEAAGDRIPYLCETCADDYCIVCNQFIIGAGFDAGMCKTSNHAGGDNCVKCDKVLAAVKTRAKLCGDCGKSDETKKCCKRLLPNR